MKIVTYNIHSGVGMDGQQNYKRIGDFLAQQNVDIALLQETDTRTAERTIDQDITDLCADHFKTLVPSPAVFSEYGWYGNAILSRFDVLDHQTIDVSFVGRQARNIQEALIDTPQGPLKVLNTHKGLKRLERREQIAKLHAHLKTMNSRAMPLVSYPILVGGDFNEWQMISLNLRKLNRLLCPHRVGATFPVRWPLLKLDRLWCKPRHIIKKAKVLKTPETRLYSDHFPIVAEVDLGYTP